jgi:hypothetical protein
MLPSSSVVCDVLLKAANSITPITNLHGVPVEVLAAVYPEKYQTNIPDEKPDNVSLSLPFGHDLLLLTSGGIGSTASLWKIISSGRDCKLFFAEGLYSKALENVKKKFIKELVTETRGNNGQPLADGSIDSGFQTWLDSSMAPKNAHLLCRKARIVLLTAMAREKFPVSSETPISLVWGCTYDCRQVFQALQPWGFQHTIPFITHDTALFALSHGEVVTDTLKEKHGVTSRTISPGPMLVPQCLNQVCSCWDHASDTDQAFAPRTELIHKPFLAMCGDCHGCKRWYEAANVLYEKFPHIRFGTKDYGNGDDDRYWENIPSMEKAPKRVFISSEEPKKSMKKAKGRPKKTKEVKDTSDTEDEDDGKEEKDEEIPESEEEENSESEDEYLYDLEEEDDVADAGDAEELPEELLSDIDEDIGYDSDAGKKKRKRKKKY